MFRPGEDVNHKLVHFLNMKEVWYLKAFGKNLSHDGPTYGDRIMVLGDKGYELFSTWQEAGQAQWQVVQNAQRAIAEVLRALQADRTGDARNLMQRNFRQVPTTYDVLKDPSGQPVVTPVVESQTPLGYGICLLGFVTQFHLFRRIRECKRCREWFVAKPAKKIFCSQECQEEFWAEYRRGEGRNEHIKRLKRWRANKKQKRGRKPE